MYWEYRQTITRIRMCFNISISSLLVGFLVIHLYYYVSPGKSIASIWWAEDQQAAQYWKQGNYVKAAELLADSPLAAQAYYASEGFASAAKRFSREHHAEAYFALGNSLAHQESYDEAILAYRMALALQPKWPEAEYNRQLAEVLKDKPCQAGKKEQNTKSDFAADDISFDLDKQNSDQAVDDALAMGELSEHSLRKLWLRQLNRKPVDFLQRKFAYQWQQQKNDSEGSQ
ncbi:tetratricopeptide repeat protein [Pseudoteredinibacter isoporae]|uniref:tetratricopeptide repeat protein n=1 Tax=Pseudoteredinibacter isoporae TaxID=570281 RepID=UPI00310AE04E